MRDLDSYRDARHDGFTMNTHDRWLFDAADAGDVVGLNGALAASADVHVQDDSALLHAAGGGHLDAVRALITAGAHLHAQEKGALYHAATSGHAEVVRLLLEAGANPHVRHDLALFQAACRGHIDVVRLLMAYGADIHINDATAFRHAAGGGYADVVSQFIAAGVDVNVDHLAVSETDRFGNLIGARRIPLVVYGKTHDQTKALIGDVSISMAEQAEAAGKPLVIEQLDFQKKKAELETTNSKQARLLSSFAYRHVAAHLKAACYRAGVDVIEVHPAYTSVIGAVNRAQRHGISTHRGAALAIARRGLGCSERPPKWLARVPLRNGGHVTLALPARNRAQHGWSSWASVRRTLKAAHAAHARSGAANTAPAPPLSATRAASSHRAFGARFPDANRAQHCSERVLDGVPW